MLSDSRTELPKDTHTKKTVSTELETKAGGLDGYPAPPLRTGPDKQNGEVQVPFRCLCKSLRLKTCYDKSSG